MQSRYGRMGGARLRWAPMGDDRIASIEEEAARRFVRWDPGLWRAVLAGPARELSDGVAAHGEGALPVVEGYLRLVAHGIGHGYLVPAELGAANFFTLAFTGLIPRLLPALAPERWPATLAQCWNLGENLETAPPWVRRLLLRAGGELRNLSDLESVVSRIARVACDPPAVRLGTRARTAWVSLAEDWRFLPGAVHFVAPAVACVHERSGGGTLCVALGETPEVLGPTGCDASPPCSREARLLSTARASDPGITGVYCAASNEWRVVATLVTSQHLVVLLPAEGG